MRKTFYQFYRPTKEEFDFLWDNCTFIFDTNVLRHLYRYPSNIRLIFFKILDKIQERIWVPYQVGLEFQQGRIKEIYEQTKKLDDIDRNLGEIKNKILEGIPKYHPHLDMDKLKIMIEKNFIEYSEFLQESNKKPSDLVKEDSVRNKIDKLFENKVGKHFTKEELDQLDKECKERFDKSVPPGFMDKKCGDFFIWQEIINYSKSNKKDVIFITDDKKEDWWLKQSGETISPRTELVAEFHSNTSQQFYMYDFKRFLELGSEKYLKKQIDKKSIDEMQQIKEMNEIEKMRMEDNLEAAKHKELEIKSRMDDLEIEDHELVLKIQDLQEQIGIITRDLATINEQIEVDSKRLKHLPQDTSEYSGLYEYVMKLREMGMVKATEIEKIKVAIQYLIKNRDRILTQKDELWMSLHVGKHIR